jgi:hypothetical protein
VFGKLEWSAEYAIYHHLPVVVSKLNDCSSKPVRERPVERLGIQKELVKTVLKHLEFNNPGDFIQLETFTNKPGAFPSGKNPVRSPGATGWFVGHSGFPWPKILKKA